MAAAGEAGAGGGEAGADDGGSGGQDAQNGGAGTPDAGSGGAAGDSSVEAQLEIAQPSIDAGKTYVPFSGKVSASGAAHYDWSITSGSLPAGLALQGAQSATVTIAGTPTEVGQFPITLSVTDGSSTKTVDVTLVVTHPALFLSDRRLAGVNELFIAEIGGESTSAPVQLSASLPVGGSVSSYAWSPDGSKVLYLAAQSPGGTAELWVASLASPGTAQRVSAPGTTVGYMVWLRGSGNIATYSTMSGDTYLADLSASAPQSKLAVAGQGAPILSVSTTENSLIVTKGANYDDFSYVSWTSGAPTTIPLPKLQSSGGAIFSYNGRFAMVFDDGPHLWWVDFPSPAPSGHLIDVFDNLKFRWSPNAEMWLMATGPSNTFEISRGTLVGGILTPTVLVPSSQCASVYLHPWSPDGRNGLFTCDHDVRGIANVRGAAVGTDFSVLPSAFLSKIFTNVGSLDWSPDSEWIAMRANRDVRDQYDLYLIRWSAPGVAHKPHASSTGSGVTTWSFAPNSQSVAFVGSIAPQTNAGLYLSKLPATGAPSTAALVSAPATAVVQDDIDWLPGSRVITYRATVSGAAQLFAVPVAADGTAGSPVPISGVSGSGVSSYQLAPAR